jgi:hypothetical protein
LDNGHIESETAQGVTAQFLEDSEPLSIQQTWVFMREVVQPFSAECLECKEPFSWQEAYDMIGSPPRRCAVCESRSRRFMD